MSAVDWDVLIGELSAKRSATAQELADIDAVLAVARARASGIPAPAKRGKGKPARARAVTKKPAKNGQRPRLDAAAMAVIQKQYEAGADVGEIARKAGKSVAGIYYYASSRGWKRPDAAKPAAKAPPTPKGQQLSGSVKCTNPDCGVMTDYDPCRRCGKKLARKGW